MEFVTAAHGVSHRTKTVAVYWSDGFYIWELGSWQRFYAHLSFAVHKVQKKRTRLSGPVLAILVSSGEAPKVFHNSFEW